MARPLRILIPDGWYHVFGRGWERRPILVDQRDRARFLELLGELHDTYRFVIHADPLMDNHHHLIVQIPDAKLSQGMQWFDGTYPEVFMNARSLGARIGLRRPRAADGDHCFSPPPAGTAPGSMNQRTFTRRRSDSAARAAFSAVRSRVYTFAADALPARSAAADFVNTPGYACRFNARHQRGGDAGEARPGSAQLAG